MKRALEPECYPSLVVGSVSGLESWQELVTTDTDCDIMELRADTLPDTADYEAMLALPRPKPIILTVRHADEGGTKNMSHAERVQLAMRLLPMATALDWEIAHMQEAQVLIQNAKKQGKIIIASAHNFEQTPEVSQLKAMENKAIELGADIVKFAFRLHSEKDILVGVKLLRTRRVPMAVMGMGNLGATSRLLYNQYGSVLTYGYLGNTPTAPGQWSAALCKAAISHLLPAES